MDPLSQAALGAAAAAAAAPRQTLRTAAVVGALAGMAPDLDVWIRSEQDPLLFLEVHRQFTHAFAFIPVGAALVALACWPWVRRRIDVRTLLLASGLGFATHGLLDACTSYGTQLLWPFSDERIAWNLVAVVDPLLTIGLVAGVALALRTRRRRHAAAALAWVALVLGVGFAQRERAASLALRLAAERGTPDARIIAKPSFANGLVWKTLAVTADEIRADAFRLGVSPLHYPGDAVPRLDRARDLPWLAAESRAARDLERFRRFSGDVLALDPSDPTRVIDGRYSMVPNRIDALWGIAFEPADAEAPPRFFSERRPTAPERGALLAMLRGLPPDAIELRPARSSPGSGWQPRQK